MNNTQLPAAPINDLDFGNLVILPDLYKASKDRVEKAKAYSATILLPVEGLDLLKVDAQEMETLMVPVRDLRTLLAEAEEEIKGERMPHTKKMDAIKSLFTGLEKDFADMTDKVKKIDTAWEGEKLRRASVATAANEKAIRKTQEAVSMRVYVRQSMTNNFTREIMAEILGMNKAYEGKTADLLPAYGEALQPWVPELEADTWTRICALTLPVYPCHTEEEKQAIRQEVVNEMWPQMAADWENKVTEDKERLIDLIPSRITELNEAATSAEAQAAMEQRLADSQAEITSTLTAEGENKAQAQELAGDTAKLDASFEVASQAVPVVAMSSGTSVKKKYKVNTHSAMVALLQSFVANDLPFMTIEEMNTKFSFVRTANDKRLNKGEVVQAKGLEVVDDITTRRASRTATA